MRLMAKGRRFRWPRQDARQLGGDVIVDRSGRIAWVYRSRNPADRPSTAEVVRRIDELAHLNSLKRADGGSHGG
jgi:hypothetical protein